MAVIYSCDLCDTPIYKPLITLTIQYRETIRYRHFCERHCLVEWIKANEDNKGYWL